MGLTKKPQEALTVGASGNLRASTAAGEAEADQIGPKDPPEGAPGPPVHLAPLTTLEHSFDIQSFTQEQIWLPLQSLQEVELVSPAPTSCKDKPPLPPTHLPPRAPTSRTIGYRLPKSATQPSLGDPPHPTVQSVRRGAARGYYVHVRVLECTGVCERLGGGVVTIQKAWVPSHSLSKHLFSPPSRSDLLQVPGSQQ